MFLSVVKICLFVAVATTCGRESEATEWHYSDVDHWADDFPNCGGQQQSPIDINTNKVVVSDPDPIQFHNYDVRPTAQTVTNDGHTIKVDISSTAARPFIAWGGPLFYQKRKYNFAQYHFHWGSVNSQGSEHTIDRNSYSMELHLVHFNDKYADIGAAFDKPDGLAVLGIFFQLSAEDNPALAPLISAIQEVNDYTATTPHYVVRNDLPSLESLLPGNTNRFYRYDGSLTNPTCDESVLWTVFYRPIKISRAQIAVFRSVIGSDGPSSDNFRPTQPRNGRKVLQSWS